MSSMTLTELAELLQSMSSQELVQLLMEFAEQYPGARVSLKNVVFFSVRHLPVEVCATPVRMRWPLPTTRFAQFCSPALFFAS